MSTTNQDHPNHGSSQPSFQLPDDDMPKEDQKVPASSSETAADLIRQKVDNIYAAEPSAAAEALDVEELSGHKKLSKHQKFIHELSTSGKSLVDVQTAWHEYYAALPDHEKHQVWKEFYAGERATSQSADPEVELAPKRQRTILGKATPHRTQAAMQDYVMSSVRPKKKLKAVQHLQSVLFGLGVGSLVLLIVLFGFFNERFIAPFIQPSRTVTSTPIIATSTEANGPNPEVIIPKINVEIPVVYGVNTINDDAVENALESGVVHYADTADPGQDGNVVVVGHSSNNIFNKGKYKFAFVLLSRLETGDTFYLQKDGKRYTYQVYKKTIVPPTDVSVLQPTDKPATATLITCDPPGTSINRLVVVGQQISPDPIANAPQTTQNALATTTKVIPGNAQSLWSRLTSSL